MCVSDVLDTHACELAGIRSCHLGEGFREGGGAQENLFSLKTFPLTHPYSLWASPGDGIVVQINPPPSLPHYDQSLRACLHTGIPGAQKYKDM